MIFEKTCVFVVTSSLLMKKIGLIQRYFKLKICKKMFESHFFQGIFDLSTSNINHLLISLET